MYCGYCGPIPTITLTKNLCGIRITNEEQESIRPFMRLVEAQKDTMTKTDLLSTLDRWIATGKEEADSGVHAMYGRLSDMRGSTLHAVEWLQRARDLAAKLPDEHNEKAEGLQ